MTHFKMYFYWFYVCMKTHASYPQVGLDTQSLGENNISVLCSGFCGFFVVVVVCLFRKKK